MIPASPGVRPRKKPGVEEIFRARMFMGKLLRGARVSDEWSRKKGSYAYGCWLFPVVGMCIDMHKVRRALGQKQVARRKPRAVEQ